MGHTIDWHCHNFQGALRIATIPKGAALSLVQSMTSCRSALNLEAPRPCGWGTIERADAMKATKNITLDFKRAHIETHCYANVVISAGRVKRTRRCKACCKTLATERLHLEKTMKYIDCRLSQTFTAVQILRTCCKLSWPLSSPQQRRGLAVLARRPIAGWRIGEPKGSKD